MEPDRKTAVLFHLCNLLADRGHQVTVTASGKGYEHAWFPLSVKPVYVEAPQLEIRRLILAGDLELALDISVERLLQSLERAVPEGEVCVAADPVAAHAVVKRGKGRAFHFLPDAPGSESGEEVAFDYIRSSALDLPLRVIVATSRLRDYLRENYGLKADLFVPGVDTEIFHPDDEPRRRSGHFLVVCPVDAIDFQGLEILNDIIERVLARVKDVDFIVCGERVSLFRIRTCCTLRKTLTPWERADLFRKADAALCIGRLLSMSLSPLEAMACAVPVVTTPFGVEDYACDGLEARFIHGDDAREAADILLELLKNPEYAARLGRNAAERAREYSWENRVGVLESFLADS